MTLKEQVLKDMKDAMKSGQSDRVKALRFLSSAIKNKEIELRPDPLTDEHVAGVLRKQIKQAKESVESYKKAGYEERAGEEEFQISVFESYLPKLLSIDELKSLVRQSIEELKAGSLKDMGAVMKAVMAKAKGSADGKALSQIVREELSKL